MKEGIHPNYDQTTIKCACGNVIETGSTKKDIKVEVCSKCHPFFTGKQKMVDTGGRVSRFNKKFGLDKKEVGISGSPYRFRYGLFCTNPVSAAPELPRGGGKPGGGTTGKTVRSERMRLRTDASHGSWRGPLLGN